MFEMPTVFVIGAGAGVELKMPIGTELADQISAMLNIEVSMGQCKRGDSEILRCMQILPNHPSGQWSKQNFLPAAHHISQALALAPSIDTFVENYGHDPEIVLLSKLGIARAILVAERQSRLFVEEGELDIRRARDTWLIDLAQRLFAGVSAQNITAAFENVTFINFNYDRCLEIFLLRALRVWFRLSPHEAVEIISRVRIYHPYGSLGPVWGSHVVPFGNSYNSDVITVADGLLTYSETVSDETLLTGMQNAMASARNVIFLGFAFHDPNMELLSPPIGIHRTHIPRVIASTKGFSDFDVGVIRDQIAGIWDRSSSQMTGYIHTLDGGCKEVFGKFWKTMHRPI